MKNVGAIVLTVYVIMPSHLTKFFYVLLFNIDSITYCCVAIWNLLSRHQRTDIIKMFCYFHRESGIIDEIKIVVLYPSSTSISVDINNGWLAISNDVVIWYQSISNGKHFADVNRCQKSILICIKDQYWSLSEITDFHCEKFMALM